MLRRPNVPRIPRQSTEARKPVAHTATEKTASSNRNIKRKSAIQRPGLTKQQPPKAASKARKQPAKAAKRGKVGWVAKLRLPTKKTRLSAGKSPSDTVGSKPETTSAEQRKTFTLRVPRGITRMVAAALLTCILPWFLFLAVSAAVYFSTSANPWMADTVWTDSLAVGSSIWALGFAVPLRGAATVSVIPVGLWIAYLWLGGRIARAFVLESRAVLWVYPLAQAIVASLVGLVVRGAYSLGSLFFWALIHGFATVAYAFYLFDRDQRRNADKPSLLHPKARLTSDFERFTAWSRTLILRLRQPDRGYQQDLENRRLGIDRDERSWDGSNSTWTVPGWVVSGVRAGWQMFIFFGLITLILVLAQVFSHFAAVSKIYDLYGVSLGAGALIWLAQLLYLPTVQTWALAWILGPGFQQGTGTIRSLTQVKAGPIPAIPILGALPEQTPGYWVPALIVGLSLVLGYLLYTTMARVDFFSHVASFLVGTLSFILLTSWFCFLSSGSIGAGRMSAWGPGALTTAAMAFILVWLPIVLVGTVAHPRARAYLADNFFKLKRASENAGRQGFASAKAKAKELQSRNPLSADSADKEEDAAPDAEESQAAPTEETLETTEIAQTPEEAEGEGAAAEGAATSADDESQYEDEGEETTENIPEESTLETGSELKSESENEQENSEPTPQAPPSPQETFARSRGALPADTEEIKDLVTDWAERRTDEVIAKEQQELEKIKSSAQRIPEAELARPAIKRSLFKRGRLKAGKPRHDADDTSTQAIEIPEQD